MNSQSRSRNPFGVTKAVDLDDSQIQSLWVNVLSVDDELARFGHPTTAMPSFVLGAKGSGKTHLMRYHSFELQLLRYGVDPTPDEIHEGVAKDGYVGIYALCGSMNSSRFTGKGQTEETWRHIFAYYLELWLSHHLLQIIEKICLDQVAESTICAEIMGLFDRPLQGAGTSIRDLADFVAGLQRSLDYAVNNAVMSGTLEVDILATRGRLIFGIPKALVRRCPFLKDVIFVYAIDEFENLTIEQQKVVNSLIRDKQIPATIRVGARLYGVKTDLTDGSEEANLKDSEYEVLALDQIYRRHKKKYKDFARELASKRLAAPYGALHSSQVSPPGAELNSFFETINDSWNSKYFLDLVGRKKSEDRVHFKQFRAKLHGLDEKAIDAIAKLLKVESFPLLEKLNLLRFYKAATGKEDPVSIATRLARECSNFIKNPESPGNFHRALDHYKSDLSAQLHRENGEKYCYLGLESFIKMSAGLPRALLTILRSVFDWSTFRGDDPLGTNMVSIDAQYQGVREAANWFYENMRKAGEDGRKIQAATDRLAQLFRVNRFADRPAEVSLCAFAISPQQGSEEAKRVLRLAEERSFLIPVIRKDKNFGNPMSSFQIHPMLAPRWELPLGRRGIPELTDEEFEAIFAPQSNDAFEKVLENWKSRTSFSPKALFIKHGVEAQGRLL